MKCVKYGTFDSQGASYINLTDLGFTNANDYVALVDGGGAGGEVYINSKGAGGFYVVGATNASYHITGSYQVLAASD